VVFTSVTYVVSHGVPVLNLPAPLLWMGGSFIGPIPVSVGIMLLVVVVMQVLLTRTRFGLRVRQVGGNVDAARLTGVNVAAITLGVFIISGLLSALGALIEVGRVGAGIPTIGSTLLFPIITSSILGGTLLSGGEGSMVGTLFGAALLTIINNALVILQVDPYAQGVAQGGLVVAALIIVACYVFRYSPTGIRATVALLQQIDPSIEEASQGLGARSGTTFRRVTLPLIVPAFFAGLGVVFIRSMTAISATIFLVSINWTLITVRILENMTELSLGPAAAFSVLVVAIVFVVMAGISGALRRLQSAGRVQVTSILGG